jgi:hypothetical protein
MASSIDKERLPRGSRGWRTFVEALAQIDDTGETHWLEMKSSLDLSRSGAAKIAKFIIGAANRLPEVAASAIEGHALMVLGVAEGTLVGIDPVEDLELEKRLTPFLGAEGPRWDTERVGIASGRDVLVIIVEPPKAGDPIHVCRRDGEGVADGDVYVRARGETRRAKSGELDLLRVRERAGVPNVELEVAVTGPVLAYSCDAGVLDEHIQRRTRVLLGRLPEPRPARSPADGSLSAIAAIVATGADSPLTQFATAYTVPENRTEDEYREEVERWAAACRAALPTLVDALLAVRAPSTTFLVRNLTSRYLSDVRLQLHLAGAVEQIAWEADDRFVAREHLPIEPRPWGPRQKDLGFGHIVHDIFSSPVGDFRPYGGPSASFLNGGSVTATFEMRELRPKGAEEFEGEVVLVVRDAEMTVVEGTWTATARDLHAVFEGSLTVPVAPVIDVSDQIRAALRGQPSE